NKVGVVGAGLMASQLALLFARRLKVTVVMTDVSEERLAKGVAWVHEQADMRLLKGRLSQAAASSLKASVTGTLDTAAAFGDADFVIEAVFEELDVKQKVCAGVEAVAPERALLAGDTSSLSVTRMGSRLTHPERVVGFHFF